MKGLIVLVCAAMVLASCIPEPAEQNLDQPLIGASLVDANKQACEADGGTFAPGGLANLLVCYKKTKDGGKSCSKSTDCQTECLARSRTCAPVTPLFGCNEILDSQGRTLVLCRD